MFYCPEICEGFLSVKKGPCFLFELNYVSPYLYCDLCPRLINLSAVAHYSAFIWQRKLVVYKTHRRRSQRSFRKNIAVKANPSTTSISIATSYLQVLLQQVKTVLIVPKPEPIMENLISGMLLITIYYGTCQFHDTLRQSFG